MNKGTVSPKMGVAKYPNPHEPAPDFTAKELGNDSYHFSTVAGRYIVLCFFGSKGNPTTATMLDKILERRDYFNDHQACFFGVTIDPDDINKNRLKSRIPGIRYFLDFDFKVSKMYGAVDAYFAKTMAYNPVSFVIDPSLRILSVVPVRSSATHAEDLFKILDSIPAIPFPTLSNEFPPPVLIVPRVFEPELCKTLIDYYNANEVQDSGFMTEENGKTVLKIDHNRKRRADCLLEDEDLRNSVRVRMLRRLVPEIQKAFQFKVTRMERYLLACYHGETGDYFSSHRDNTTKGTAHRRFAVSLALNTGEYEGGGLQVPEFSSRVYNPPSGGALVFSCSLQHRAMPVKSGKRYMFLPFLYDDDAAKIREENLKYLDENLRNDLAIGGYKSGKSSTEKTQNKQRTALASGQFRGSRPKSRKKQGKAKRR